METIANNVLVYYSIDGGNNWTQSINDSANQSPSPFVENASIQNAAISLNRYIFTLINSKKTSRTNPVSKPFNAFGIIAGLNNYTAKPTVLTPFISLPDNAFLRMPSKI